MSNSLSTRHYPTVAEANHGFEIAISGEPDFAFLGVESLDEWDPGSRIPSEEIKRFEREVASRANASIRRDSDPPARSHFRLLNAGGPPDQLLPPALLQDQCLWSSEKLPPPGSPSSFNANIRPPLSFPWSIRDDTPRDIVRPQLSLTGAQARPQPPNLIPSSARANRERRLNGVQRREFAAIRIRTCEHCGVYICGSRRLHDKSHCMAFEKENIDPN
ncbi:hypothetical protein BDN71DRAFT_1504088 [Pleurotus eryngii]|uniref:Uncharacterized protein n=1 Tax=Pleurotus eryngii TaxID=5323 RepID=A0A9P6A6X7_PLEER|nr:hypothetical protein BDN71DRAFT_1504088 [Pleurotus eryngii]